MLQKYHEDISIQKLNQARKNCNTLDLSKRIGLFCNIKVDFYLKFILISLYTTLFEKQS